MILKDVDLLKLQTIFMQQDKTTKAMCAALTPQIKDIANSISKCIIFADIDNLDEGVLDQLAFELDITWYDPTASTDIKKALIKNSDKVHMYMGTPYAVEQVIQDYFGDGYVEEWYKYSGDPYHFRVITSNPSVTGELAELFASAIDKVKRKSAVIDNVVVELIAQMDLYYCCELHIGDTYTIEQGV